MCRYFVYSLDNLHIISYNYMQKGSLNVHKFDYSFLNNGLLPANSVNLTFDIYSLKTAAVMRKDGYVKVFTD